MTNKEIEIVNAYENNLKNITTHIPHNCICGICGVSGSGKTSLAKSVIARFGERNFYYSLPSFMRGKFYKNNEAKVDNILNLPSVYMIDVKNSNRNIRSTVATSTNILSYLRDLFCIESKNSVYPRLFSYNILEENGGGACSLCKGTGIADTIILENIIGDINKSIFKGGFVCINEKGIKNTKVSDLFLKAFCEKNHISYDKPVNEYSREELNLLFNGTNQIIDFTDRSGANGGKKSLTFSGISGSLLDVYIRTKNEKIEKLIVKGICPSCNGTRYREQVLSYKVDGKTITDILSMSINDFANFINTYENENAFEIINKLREISNALVRIGIGYLELSRDISSVSGGELQRLKIAKCISTKIFDSCFILDEPSLGLHSKDIDKLISELQELKKNNNTIIIIEHNRKLLSYCDYILELGEKGGDLGGKIIYSGPNINKYREATNFFREKKKEISDFITLKGITCHNVINETINIPINSFTTIIGVSGSGKSSAINNYFFNKLNRYLKGEIDPQLKINTKLSNVYSLVQEQGVTNSCSIVATYLGIFDIIREIFSDLPESKNIGFTKSHFSLSRGLGLCDLCQGKGTIQNDDNDAEEICPLCEGDKFDSQILKIKYKELNIAELLSSDIHDIVPYFSQHSKVVEILKCCEEIGIGYLSLGREMPSLSKGELQRLRLAKEIADYNSSNCIYILDEPSKGLSDNDIELLLKSLDKLIKKGNTIIAIEHNALMISQSDYCIEFGPGAGKEGGKIIYSGRPSQINTSDIIPENLLNERSLSNAKSLKSVDININDKIYPIKKYTVTLISGGIASGKTFTAKNILFGNSFKKYVSLVNTQGKYLTRNIFAAPINNQKLPLCRLINATDRFYKKNERVSETLDLDQYISNLFYEHGEKFCSNCNTSLGYVNFYGKCKCGNEIKFITNKNAFAYSKKSCKCPVCNGDGEHETYNFNEIINNEELFLEVKNLLLKRERFSKMSQLLKSSYDINIDKDFGNMSKEEQRIFLYGDRKLIVYDEDWKRDFFWPGCNDILKSSLSYLNPNYVERIKNTYSSQICTYCKGTGLMEDICSTKLGSMDFLTFMNTPIQDLYLYLCNYYRQKKLNTDVFIKTLNDLISYGMGNIHLGIKTRNLSVGQLSLVQFILYKRHPIFNTLLLWDDFSAGKNKELIDILINDLQLLGEQGITSLIFDGNSYLVNKSSNVIQLNEIPKEHILKENSKNVLYIHTEDETEKVDRNNFTISSRVTLGSVSSINNTIKNIFKTFYPSSSFSLSKENEKCKDCEGSGYYEINAGNLGYVKHKCPKCKGTGFNDSILSKYIDEFNFPLIMNNKIKDIQSWIKKYCTKEDYDFVEYAIGLGLGNISLNKNIGCLSYNEASILFLLKFIFDSEEKVLRVKNLFIDLDASFQNTIINIIDTLCSINSKKVYIYDNC